MIVASGKNADLSFDGALIQIRRTGSGLGTFLNQGVQGDRFIVAKTITAIEFRETGKGGNGFIAFDFPGKNPPRGGVFDAATDENAVIFLPDQLQAFNQIRDSILEHLKFWASQP